MIRLRIDEPCHERWKGMQASPQGRFCQSCQKEVFDFRGKNPEEIGALLKSHNENICARVDARVLETKKVKPWKWRSKLAAAALFIFGLGLSGCYRRHISGRLSAYNWDYKPDSTKAASTPTINPKPKEH